MKHESRGARTDRGASPSRSCSSCSRSRSRSRPPPAAATTTTRRRPRTRRRGHGRGDRRRGRRRAASGSCCPTRRVSDRWEKDDRRFFEEAFEAAGVEFNIVNAEGDASTQLQQAEQAINAGAKVILLVNLSSESRRDDHRHGRATRT